MEVVTLIHLQDMGPTGFDSKSRSDVSMPGVVSITRK